MAERFGSQTHPSGGARFGSQTYAAIDATAGDLAAVETGPDTFYAEAQPTIHVTADMMEVAADAFAASGTSSFAQTMQAHESPTSDTFIASGVVTNPSSVRFGDQDHPLGGLRFGLQGWAALGPNGSLAATETGDDVSAAVGWLAGIYQFHIFDVLASFVDYGSESLGAAIDGTLEDGYKVMLPVSADGIAFTWETNEFGNPSLRLANLTGTTNLDDVPWYVWDGSAWTAATFDVSDALQGAAFMVETGADAFAANGSDTRYGTGPLVETGEDFTVITGSVLVTGALAAAESGADAFAAAGAPHYVGTAILVEAELDVMEVTGVAVVTGDMAATETGVDAFAATGAPSHAGDLAAVETGADAFVATGRLSSTGAMAVTESATADTLAGAGAVSVRGALAANESGADVFAADGASDRVGMMALAEIGIDTTAISGTVLVSGDLSVIDAADRFAATGQRESQGDVIAAELAALEGGADLFVVRGRVHDGDLEPVPDFDGEELTVTGTGRFRVTSAEAA